MARQITSSCNSTIFQQKQLISYLCIIIILVFLIVKEIYTSIDISIDQIDVVNNNTVRDHMNDHLLDQDLAAYLRRSRSNLSTWIQHIRSIEDAIYFDNINIRNTTNINPLFHSGTSPHFYGGNFSFEIGKTCKLLRHAYHCTPNAIINKAQLNEWTLRINESLLSSETSFFLKKLQSYNIYRDVYSKFVSNLKRFRSPYIKPINIYFFGNSHMKQIVQGQFCLMDDIEININGHSYNKMINFVIPTISKKYNLSAKAYYDYNTTFCYDIPNWKSFHWRSSNDNGPGNDYQQYVYELYNRSIKENIKHCHGGYIYSQLNDKTNLTMHFNHRKRNKQIMKMLYNDKMVHGFKRIKKEFDIIVFNVGNEPAYQFETDLFYHDLEQLNHLNKPVLMVSPWWDWFKNEHELIMDNKTFINQLYEKYPNLIWINYYKRHHLKLIKYDNEVDRHYGKYRWILSEGEPWGHFCQPGVVEHYIVALTELINLLLTLYQSE
eukprot:214068_1